MQCSAGGAALIWTACFSYTNMQFIKWPFVPAAFTPTQVTFLFINLQHEAAAARDAP